MYRTLAINRLSDVQFAGEFKEAGNDQDFGKTAQGKPDIAEAAGALNPDLADIDLERAWFSLIEEGVLDRGISFIDVVKI